MGIFDIFQRKTEQTVAGQRKLQAMQGHLQEAFSTVHENVTQVSDALKNLHADLSQQKEWLKYIHQHHLSLRDQHTGHRELTKSEVTKLQSWVTYLHKASQKQEKQLSVLQTSLSDLHKTHEKHVEAMVDAINRIHKKASEKPAPQIIEKEVKVDTDALKYAILKDMNIDLHALQTQIKRELHEVLSERIEELHTTHAQKVEELLEESKKTPPLSQPAVIVQHTPVAETPLLPPVSSLANPEQKLLNLLMNEADPLSYTKISQMTGHSINTIRVTMNTLKKKGLIEETTLPSGVKLFSVTTKEKVRKMYNISVL